METSKLAEDVAYHIALSESCKTPYAETIKQLLTEIAAAAEALELCRPEHVTRLALKRLAPLVALSKKEGK